MAKTAYGIVKATKLLPERDLFRVPHKKGTLIVGFPAFGPNTYLDNIQEMQKSYSHSRELPKISFRNQTTAESISVAAYDFENLAKPQIFDSKWLQAGYIVRTSQGVFANPPKDKQGNIVSDEKKLTLLLNGVKPIKVCQGKVYLGENDFGFADYNSFQRGVQDCDTFAEGGLARILEHSDGVVQNLRKIASPKNYKRGVNVSAFDSVKEPIVRVARLGSCGGIDGDRLSVSGDDWFGSYGDGYAFGGLNSAEGSAPKN